MKQPETHTHAGQDKKQRYSWVTKDQPGVLQMLPKGILRIHPDYQRDAVHQKVLAIAATWSWVSLGALVIGHRSGQYWVIDGQHRVMAANKRSDITDLPCVVFETVDVKQEARSFIDMNTGRRQVTAYDKQKALFAAGDEVAAFVREVCRDLGVRLVKTANSPGDIQSINWCMKKAAENRPLFTQVVTLATEICKADGMPIPEKLLDGFWALANKCEQGLDTPRLRKRLCDKGGRALLAAAQRASAFYARGGGNVWADGMLAEVNKGLSKQIALKDQTS